MIIKTIDKDYKEVETPRKILFYDIETKPLQAYIWRLGEQSIRHGQLVKGQNTYDIISIAYAWDHEEEVHVMGWGFEEQDSSTITEKMDALIREADVVIGKNNERFDNKHLNLHRMLANRDGMPDWSEKSDDLERHMRRQFALPSQSLDYISELLGLGGKEKMEFNDWVHIVEKTPELGLTAYEKMLHYNKKDVEDTRAIWRYASKHFKLKHNAAIGRTSDGELKCIHCGSADIAKNGTGPSGGVMYQKYMCRTHKGYAGKHAIRGAGSTLR